MKPDTKVTEPKDAPLHGFSALKQLRDEIRLEIHLASMEAKEAWKNLEPRIHGAEHASHEALEGLLKQYREFRSGLKKPNHPA